MAREAPILRLSSPERQQLQQLAQARLSPQGLAFRARLILRCGQDDKPTNLLVAAELGCDPDTVSRWRRRFQRQSQARRPRRPRKYSSFSTPSREYQRYLENQTIARATTQPQVAQDV